MGVMMSVGISFRGFIPLLVGFLQQTAKMEAGLQ
jgi:hypothetical protein